jgi:hypothetical protein
VAGRSPTEAGEFTLAIRAIYGADFEGGHESRDGIAADGTVTTVPLHRHDVGLDFLRVEAEGRYQWDETRSIWLRVPYDIKVRTASTRLIEPATPTQQQEIERNLGIHHPAETLHGLGDLQLLGSWSSGSVFSDGDTLTVAAGFTIPTGKTENDPYVAGDAGQRHEHIQFGTGTIDPLVELYYSHPVADAWHAVGSISTRTPLYQNDKGYRGAFESTAAVGLQWRATERFTVHAFSSLFYQDFARWRGRRDVNTGVISFGGSIGGRYDLGGGAAINLDVRVPFAQDTLSSNGDGFEQGPLYLLGVEFGV